MCTSPPRCTCLIAVTVLFLFGCAHLTDIEENCRDALSEYCSQNIKPTEEMHCLQEHFEQKEFKERYGRCYTEVERFTQMESRDTKLNRLLTQACRPVISTYCAQYQTQEIDHGDVMECLAAHKEADEMSTKCRSYVNHFELISLRDYHFNYRFTQACQDDIRMHCVQFGQDKGAIIRCLSNIVFEHRVLGEQKDLSKDCKKQLRVAYLQQEQVDVVKERMLVRARREMGYELETHKEVDRWDDPTPFNDYEDEDEECKDEDDKDKE